MPPDTPSRDRLQRLIITIRLLRHFCQLLEKLWTTLLISCYFLVCVRFSLFSINKVVLKTFTLKKKFTSFLLIVVSIPVFVFARSQ